MAGTVKDEGPESMFSQGGGCLLDEFVHGCSSGLEFRQEGTEVVGIGEGGMPESRNVTVAVYQNAAVNEALHYCGQGYDSAPSEWLEQNGWCRGPAEPLAGMRNQPSLSARVSERRPLGHGSDVRGSEGRDGDSGEWVADAICGRRLGDMGDGVAGLESRASDWNSGWWQGVLPWAWSG